jgi:hypothetical protein
LTPTGFGEAEAHANVVISHGGVCALVAGITIIEALIEIINNIATIAIVDFLQICIFFSPKFKLEV